jgi:outer membrane scaffolding protein for murein synthesis (MipA/OmpV family)
MPEVDMNRGAHPPANRSLPPACRAIATGLLAACWAAPVHADERPLWEIGLGAGAIAFEDYRGSNTTHAYPLPVPYLIYNGKFLKADRDGVRGTLFNQNWLEINLSFNLTTPVRNDRERSGMPDLRSTVEMGPRSTFTYFAATPERSSSICACRSGPRPRSNLPPASSAGHSVPDSMLM